MRRLTGVAISAVTSTSSVPSSTNESGAWSFPNLIDGNYSLIFTKSGFGTVESFSDTVNVSDTTKVPTVTMSEPPTDMISLQDFEIIAPNTINYSCQMPTPYNTMRTVVCCLSTDSASLAANPYEAPWIFASAEAGGYAGDFNMSSDTTLSEDSLAHGTIIYATVCVAGEGTNYGSFSRYYNPITKQEVYSALGPHSRMLSVMVP